MRRESIARKPGLGGRRSAGLIEACALFTVAAVGSLLAGLGSLDPPAPAARMADIHCASEDAEGLRTIVRSCLTSPPGACAYMGLAIDSISERDRSRTRIHPACVQSDVIVALQQHAAEIRSTWAEKPFLSLRGHTYNVMRMGKDALDRRSAFPLRTSRAHGAVPPTLAVIESEDGLYLLHDSSGDDDPGHAEALLEGRHE
ncbi:hypothetical protein A7982_13477 [Minicystis rosea]|nr:hypothetical protein A7982_13477 [Minicystis rosea]